MSTGIKQTKNNYSIILYLFTHCLKINKQLNKRLKLYSFQFKHLNIQKTGLVDS